MSQPTENDPNRPQPPPSQPSPDNPLPSDPSPPHNPARNTPPEPLSAAQSTPFSGRTVRDFIQFHKSFFQRAADQLTENLKEVKDLKANTEKEMNERVEQLKVWEKEDRESTGKWMVECDKRIGRTYELKADIMYDLGGITLVEKAMETSVLDGELDEETRIRMENYFIRRDRD